MRRRSYCSAVSRILTLLVAVAFAAACGDSDDAPASPSPMPGAAGSTAISIENFTATSTAAGGGTFNYRASLRVRETGGASATITGVSLTLTQTSGVTITRDVTPAEAFPTTTVAANGTLESNTLSVTGVPVQASQLAVRITYASANGTSSTVQAATTITSG